MSRVRVKDANTESCCSREVRSVCVVKQAGLVQRRVVGMSEDRLIVFLAEDSHLGACFLPLPSPLGREMVPRVEQTSHCFHAIGEERRPTGGERTSTKHESHLLARLRTQSLCDRHVGKPTFTNVWSNPSFCVQAITSSHLGSDPLVGSDDVALVPRQHQELLLPHSDVPLRFQAGQRAKRVIDVASYQVAKRIGDRILFVFLVVLGKSRTAHVLPAEQKI